VNGTTRFTLDLPPAGSTFVVAMAAMHSQAADRIIGTNIVIDSITNEQIGGYGRTADARVVVLRDGEERVLTAAADTQTDALTLNGEWKFVAEDANALVIGKWLATAAALDTPPETYAAPDADTREWLPMVPGAWSYQLPAEPDHPYPIDVWYRITFEADYVPPTLDLIVDGFAGLGWQIYVNGQFVPATPTRSAFDSQMQAMAIGNFTQLGTNTIAICLTVTNATDGVLDLLKLTGDFSLQRRDDMDVIAAPRDTALPAPWTEQGYPFFSGRAVYRKDFDLPDAFAGQRVFLYSEMADDVLEVIVNGQQAGVRLWAPYTVEITNLIKAGENTVELRVANTLVNLLEAVARPSGLAGAPRLVPYRRFVFDLANKHVVDVEVAQNTQAQVRRRCV
jgi:hypothetical protein